MKETNMKKLLIIAVVSVATIMAIALAATTQNNPSNDLDISPTPSPTNFKPSGGSPTPTASPKTNESAIISFDVPIQIFEDEHKVFSGFYAGVTKDSPRADDYYDYHYTCIGYIAWEPKPYVRYYEINVHYNGNTKHSEPLYNGGDYRTWDDPGVTGSARHSFGLLENKTLYAGPESIEHMFGSSYVGQYTASPIWWVNDDGVEKWGPTVWSPDMHGRQIIGVTTFFDHSEKLTRAQMDAVEIEMRNFLTAYIQGWTFTIRNIS
jgi:hypothetical protein